MPLYEFEHCEERFTEFQAMEDAHKARCPKCGKKARRLYGFGKVDVEFRPGWDDGLGVYVDTKKQREDVMRAQGARRIRD